MIPQLGLGTFGRNGEDGTRAMLTAISIGYRHLDTAQSDNSEANVGETMRRSGLPPGRVLRDDQGRRCIDPVKICSCYKGEGSDECDDGRRHQAVDGEA